MPCAQCSEPTNGKRLCKTCELASREYIDETDEEVDDND